MKPTVPSRRVGLKLLSWPLVAMAGFPLPIAAQPASREAGAPATTRPAGAPPRAQRSHLPFGPVVPPEPMPSLRMIGDDGRAFDLRARLTGRITLVQLMFTGCSATCPIQGAVFSGVLPRLPERTQLLSISIDALNDDAKALRGWLARFGNDPRWRAAVPARVSDVDVLFDLLSGRARGPDPHTANVYLVDRQARLIFKTAEMPPAEELVTLLQQALQRS